MAFQADAYQESGVSTKKLALKKITQTDGTDVYVPYVANDASLGTSAVSNSTGNKTFSAVSVLTTDTTILAANASRKAAIIRNNGTVAIYLGKDATVSNSNGLPLNPGETLNDTNSVDAWHAVTASGTCDVRVCEVA